MESLGEERFGSEVDVGDSRVCLVSKAWMEEICRALQRAGLPESARFAGLTVFAVVILILQPAASKMIAAQLHLVAMVPRSVRWFGSV